MLEPCLFLFSRLFEHVGEDAHFLRFMKNFLGVQHLSVLQLILLDFSANFAGELGEYLSSQIRVPFDQGHSGFHAFVPFCKPIVDKSLIASPQFLSFLLIKIIEGSLSGLVSLKFELKKFMQRILLQCVLPELFSPGVEVSFSLLPKHIPAQ